MTLDNPALTFSLALAAGMIAQILAIHLRIPGIVLLLLAGVLLGPDSLDVIRPDTLGHALEILVGLSVAVILFEGGLSLNISRIRKEARTIRLLITVGAVVTAIGGTLAARLFMGWSWTMAILFGTLVIVTGPTVITPLLRRIRVSRNVGTILEAEGVLIDPIGAIVAVVALELVLVTGPSTTVELLGLPARLLVGAAVGGVGGFLIGYLMRAEKLISEGMENVFTLSLVLALYAASNAILPESGIMAAVAAGLVVGNMETGLSHELREFKESLTVMLVGLLFVLLAADMRLAEVVALGWGGVVTVLALMLVVRPLAVGVSTAGSTLSWKERGFIAWLGPRGIVAAAVASLFAHSLTAQGVAGGRELRALVFLVIAATVVIQGLPGGLVANALGVRRPRNGYVIIGANAIGRTLARLLGAGGESVTLVGSNRWNIRAAEEEGLKVVLGNANDESRLLRADIEGRNGFLAATTNEGVNLLLVRKAREQFRVPQVSVALYRGKAGVQKEQVHENGASVLFGSPIDIDQWSQRFQQDTATVEAWAYEGDGEITFPLADANGREPMEVLVLPLAMVRNGSTYPVTDVTGIRARDIVMLGLPRSQMDATRRRLREAGWKPAMDDGDA